jgi:hypothetical protein
MNLVSYTEGYKLRLVKRIRSESQVLVQEYCFAKYVGRRKKLRNVLDVNWLDTVEKGIKQRIGRFTRRFVNTRMGNVFEREY